MFLFLEKGGGGGVRGGVLTEDNKWNFLFFWKWIVKKLK